MATSTTCEGNEIIIRNMAGEVVFRLSLPQAMALSDTLRANISKVERLERKKWQQVDNLRGAAARGEHLMAIRALQELVEERSGTRLSLADTKDIVEAFMSRKDC